MSELAETAPFTMLEDVFFAPLLQAIQVPGITRGCAAVDDVSFALVAVLRVLKNSKTGRDSIQPHGIPTNPGLTRSNYFDGLSSPRCLKMFIALDRELQRQQLPPLRGSATTASPILANLIKWKFGLVTAIASPTPPTIPTTK